MGWDTITERPEGDEDGERLMPFKSKKQREFLKRHRPKAYETIKRKHGEKVGGGKLKG